MWNPNRIMRLVWWVSSRSSSEILDIQAWDELWVSIQAASSQLCLGYEMVRVMMAWRGSASYWLICKLGGLLSKI